MRKKGRADRKPSAHSRICSCHFPSGKNMVPVLFPASSDLPIEQILEDHSYFLPEENTVNETIPLFMDEEQESATLNATDTDKLEDPQPPANKVEEQQDRSTTKERLQSEKRKINQLGVNLEHSMAEIRFLKDKLQRGSHCRERYSASQLSESVLQMETGLPDKDTFCAVCEYVARSSDSITYHSGWRPKKIDLEDQIFMTLMKLRQNYTNLHLAALFHCNLKTVRNVLKTFIEVLHKLLFKDIMSTVPSREKNKACMPSSFVNFQNCRMIMDYTDITIAIPKQLETQKETYSSYRGMHSFKVLIGVAPNAVITYCSKLYPGATSDKEIVQDSGVLDHLKSGDLILADKGFLIHNILPDGVTVNIPPFLNHG